MYHSAKQRWHRLDKQQRIELLSQFFYEALFDDDFCPSWMMDMEDRKEVVRNANIKIISTRHCEKYALILSLESFTFNFHPSPSQNLLLLADFLRRHLGQVRLGSHKLFQSFLLQNQIARLDFNLRAIFNWMD